MIINLILVKYYLFLFKAQPTRGAFPLSETVGPVSRFRLTGRDGLWGEALLDAGRSRIGLPGTDLSARM